MLTKMQKQNAIKCIEFIVDESPIGKHPASCAISNDVYHWVMDAVHMLEIINEDIGWYKYDEISNRLKSIVFNNSAIDDKTKAMLACKLLTDYSKEISKL